MNLENFIIALTCLGGIAFTYWFFLMKKEDNAVIIKTKSVDIIVKGGYNPSVISITKGRLTTLNFIRKDPSSCLEEVVLPDFKIRKYLPINEKTAISLTPQKEGNFEISCGMNMFHGRIIVEDPKYSTKD